MIDLTKLLDGLGSGDVEAEAVALAEHIKEMPMRKAMVLIQAMGILSAELQPPKSKDHE